MFTLKTISSIFIQVRIPILPFHSAKILLSENCVSSNIKKNAIFSLKVTGIENKE